MKSSISVGSRSGVKRPHSAEPSEFDKREQPSRVGSEKVHKEFKQTLDTGISQVNQV